MEIKILALSDTIGVSNPENISYLFSNLIPPYPDVEFGAHLHTQPHNWREKIDSAYQSGCVRFDAAMKGYGGCPMAKDELTGNMPTENLISYFDERKIDLGINRDAFLNSMSIVPEVFNGRE
jgi:hydroxymethylglutaryl-CoA lyase